MEPSENLAEALIAKADAYGKTSLELLKLKLLDSTAIVATLVISRMCFLLVFFMFFIFLNVGLALLAGEYIGKLSTGFLLVSAVNGIALIVIYFYIGKLFKNSIYSFLINQFIKPS